jgi:Xaa-Pro aminopeptidase
MPEPGGERFSPQIASACDARRARLRSDMASREIEALLVSCSADIRYLSGFAGDDSLLLVDGEQAVIVSDPRYDEFLRPWDAGGTRVVMGTRHRLPEAVAALCRAGAIRTLAVQAEHLTVRGRRAIADAIGGVDLIDTEGVVGALRMRKDDLEIATIERAARIQAEALHAALERLTVGMSELSLCAAIEYEMKVRGASGPSFATMVATGPRSSIIHHETGGAAIGEGLLLIDWGAIVNGYRSDMTRTFGLGGLPPKARELYVLVLEAQLAAIEAARPGMRCAELDAVARRIIEAGGYGDHFTHGLGHGLGLDIHEEPFLNQLNTGVVLEPGMVVTIEPGVYLPGVGGVRLEDDLLITPRGSRLLTRFPKGPEEAVLDVAAARAAR